MELAPRFTSPLKARTNDHPIQDRTDLFVILERLKIVAYNTPMHLYTVEVKQKYASKT